MEIPWQELKPDTLQRVIEEFITREGTEYGSVRLTLEEQVARVRTQLKRGEAVLVFQPEDETCHIIPKVAARAAARTARTTSPTYLLPFQGEADDRSREG